VLDYENQVQPIRSLGCQLTHNSYKVFSHIVMLTLHRDKTFGSSATQKKVLVSRILADVVAVSASWIAVKTKEYEFNLCSYHDIIPHSICTTT